MSKVLLTLLFAAFLAAPAAADTVICTHCREVPYTEEELKEIEEAQASENQPDYDADSRAEDEAAEKEAAEKAGK
jgi:hypothetical protein